MLSVSYRIYPPRAVRINVSYRLRLYALQHARNPVFEKPSRRSHLSVFVLTSHLGYSLAKLFTGRCNED